MKSKKIIFTFLLITMFLFSFAQNEIRKYIGNIVDVGNNEFGFIVGKNNQKVYFVTITATESNPLTVPVRFYKSGTKSEADLVKKIPVRGGFIYLFAVNVPENLEWQPYSYTSLNNSSGSFYTFLDNGKSDSLWYINNSKIQLNDRISPEVGQLRVPSGDLFYRGMPVIDESNRIVGLIMERQEVESSITFLALDIKVIQAKLDDLGRCKYFQLIQFGQSGTPCKIEEEIAKQKREEQAIVKQNNRIYGLVLGPSFSFNYNFGSFNGVSLGGIGFSTGINVYLKPDKGKFRITIKPRYTYSPLGVEETYQSTSQSGYKPIVFRVRQFEAPFMLEWITKRNRADLSAFIGFGYAPVYQLPLIYKYTISADTVKGKLESIEKFVQKVAFEFGFEGSGGRVSLNARYQLNNWDDPEAHRQINGYSVAPTAGAVKGYLLIGMEYSYRFKGKWGLKVK